MTGKMLAVMKKEREQGAELDEVDIPTIKPNEILVKVKATSICGTDVHIYSWDPWAEGRIKPPMIFGHECAGEVVEVGKDVRSIKVGDYVSAETHIPCGHCYQCRTGDQHLCQNLKILGVDVNGCFAEYVAIPEICAWKNDPSLPPDIACLKEPLGNATYAVMESEVTAKTVAIIGDGPIGIFATAIAKAAGAAFIFLVGKSPYRMELAKKMNPDLLLNVDEVDVVETIMEETKGIGVDVVIEMSGSRLGIEQGFKILRRAGTFTAFGIPKGKIEFDLSENVIFKGARIIGINGRKMFDTWYQMSRFLERGKIDIAPVVTHRFPLTKFEEGISLPLSEERNCGKVVFFPEQS
ncbi:MAG: L-threonine 3-dehydrogenase [Acidobacteria bacterium]|nr:L-threonine 3-dehydrogenase [Acidobacteriota bacterium]